MPADDSSGADPGGETGDDTEGGDRATADGGKATTDGGKATADGGKATADGGKSTRSQTGSLTERIEALHSAATDIGSATTREEACERTVSAAADILAFNICTIGLYEDGMLVPKASSSEMPEDGTRAMSPTEGLAGETFQSGDSQLVDDVAEHDAADPTDEEYRSGISVPIGERGVFQAVDETTGAFDEQDVRLADLLVSHTASVLERIEREQRLREKNQRLENFAGLVSHDLRNPLSRALARAEIAIETGDVSHVEHVVTAIKRIDGIIDDLLVLAREGEVAGETTDFDLRQTVGSIWDDIDAPDATLVCIDSLIVEATDSHLHHLLDNLLRNAVDHGGDDVAITVGTLDGGMGFYVADDGPGISSDRRDGIFEPGETSDDEGTGFGLTIVDEVATALDWKVSVTDSESGGARFEIVTDPSRPV